MSKLTQYKAKREFKLDCGHTVQAGEVFVVVSFFTCVKHGEWMRDSWNGPFPKLGDKERV